MAADENLAAMMTTVRHVAGEAARRGNAIDKERAFPPDLFDQLEACGFFRLCAPKRFGGFELTLADMNALIIEGARGLGSLGWLMMVGASQSIGSGMYPEETVAETFGKGAVRSRGVIAPKGVATPVDGGYRVSGQWPFASGGPSPDFVNANCIVMVDGKPLLGESGPEAILAMVPAKDVEFLDTWHTIGMRGTDSCDVRVSDVFVPKSRTFSLMDAQTCFDTPVARLPLRVALSFPHSALAIGIAQGALDDIVELAAAKSRSMNPAQRIGDAPLFRHELGRCSVRLAAARAMLDRTAEQCWEAGTSKRELSPEEVLTARLMSNHITSEAAAIVDWAYNAGGSSVVYEGSSLQMRFRDIHVATQHASCHADPYQILAAVLMGDEVSKRDLF